MRPQEIIAKKRDGGELTAEEIAAAMAVDSDVVGVEVVDDATGEAVSPAEAEAEAEAKDADKA